MWFIIKTLVLAYIGVLIALSIVGNLGLTCSVPTTMKEVSGETD